MENTLLDSPDLTKTKNKAKQREVKLKKEKKPFKFPKIKFRGRVVALFWFGIMLSLVAFVDKRQAKRVVQKVDIVIDNEYNNHFIDDKDVKSLLTLNDKENLENESHQFISLKELERRVKEHGFVEGVIVSKDLKGNINVNVTQYQPVARLSLGNGQGRYVSTSGKILPLLERFTARVMVFDGSYNQVLAQKDWKEDSLRKPYFEFINKVQEDPFLKVMVSSVFVNWRGEITIYPQIGKQTIEFGLPENQDVKFAMLKAFYRKIVPVKGWNRYEKVSLKFDNQLVCE